jgi:hypothetical protein
MLLEHSEQSGTANAQPKGSIGESKPKTALLAHWQARSQASSINLRDPPIYAPPGEELYLLILSRIFYIFEGT